MNPFKSSRFNRRTVALTIGIVAVSVHPAGFAQQWVELGPAPITSGPFTGRSSAIVASPTTADKYYLAGASGGVWRTLDGGATWTPMTDQLAFNAIGALALDPTNENVVYAGSGEANFANHSFYGVGLFKSTDGGETWNVLAAESFAGRTFSRIVVSHADPQTVYAAIMQAGGFPELNAAKGHPQRNDPVGVYRSNDGGLSWALLSGGLPATAASDLWIDPTDASILYVAIGDIFGPADNGIYKSTDGGDSWTKLSGGLPTSNNGRISLAIAPSDSQRVYAMITNPASPTGGGASTKGVFRSDNGGLTWQSVSPGNIQATYGWYLSTMIVDPNSSDVVFAGGLSLVRSTNGGANWTTITPPHVDMHGMAYDTQHRLLCANDGGLHVSTNNGTNWSALNSGLGIVQFYAGLSLQPGNGVFVLGGTQDNGTNRREGLLNWSNRLGGDGGYTAIHPKTPDSMWAEFQGTGNLYFSSNGGNTFSWRGSGINSSDRNCFLPPITYNPTSPTTLLYATHRIYRTTNTGLSWTPISGDLTGGGSAAVRALVIAPSNPQTVYAATNDGRVLRSIDGGFSWDAKLIGVPGGPRVTREIAVDPLDDSVAYLAVSQFGVDQVRRTTDRGDTWQAIDGNLPDLPANTIAVYRTPKARIVFVGTDGGVFMAGGDETDWSLYGDGMPLSPVNDLVVSVDMNRLVASTMGRGMWSIELPIPGAPAAIPTVGTWGMGWMLLLVLVAATAVVARRRTAGDGA